MPSSRSTGGGSGGGGGYSFQDAITTWVSVQILAEQGCSLRWELPSDVSFARVCCETRHSVDDIAILTSAGGGIYIQSKRGITCSKRLDSELAKTVDQFVRQFNTQRHSSGGDQPWNRPLDSAIDRLVLVTDHPVPAWVVEDAPKLLHRFRSDSSFASINDACQNQRERDFSRVLVDHIQRSWEEVAGRSPQLKEIRELLELVWFDHLDLGIDGREGTDDLFGMNMFATVYSRKLIRPKLRIHRYKNIARS